ncbi:MAG: hypothetical protein KGJ57_21375 [Sphingomonadales bacterium]|nr:hypothetical protein [Sphingomonadales bacterium]MDE2171945.1 hypothetical protein [Sphingomonadales bacterium]
MVDTHHAQLWGAKAALDGLPLSSNPYLSSIARAAWQAGYNKSRKGRMTTGA